MTDRNTYRRVVLPLVFALVVVALAGIALSGAVMAESGGDGEAVVYENSDDVEAQQEGSTEITIDEQRSTLEVTEGGTIELVAIITNNYDRELEHSYTLEISEVDSVTDTIFVGPGESELVVLGWETESGDAGDYDGFVEVQSELDTDTDRTPITVGEAEPAGEVTIETPVYEHEDEFTVTTSNFEDLDPDNGGELTLRYRGDIMVEDRIENIGQGTITWNEWDLSEGGTITARLIADGSLLDESVITVTAQEPEGTVNLQDPIYEDEERFDVTAQLDGLDEAYLFVDYPGEAQDDGPISDGETVSPHLPDGINSGDDITVELYETNDRVNQLGTDSTTVSSVDPADFQVTIDRTNSPVTVGDPLEVTATITNTGDEGDTQDVVLDIDERPVDGIEGLELGSGESTTETFTWTGTREPGEYNALVRTGDDSDGTTVRVTDEEDDGGPTFDVTIAETNSPVEEGEDARVIVSVENTGDESAGQEITLEIGEYEEVDSDSVRLEPGDTHRMTLIWETESGDAGDHRAIVASEDTEDATGIHVEGDEYTPDAAEFAVDSLDTNTPREGEELVATAEVTNVGGEAGEQTVELRINGDTVDHTDVMLDPEESEEVSLVWQTEVGDAGEHEVVVASYNESAGDSVSVREDTDDAYLDVDILGTNTPVEGSDITVRVEVENLGEETGEQEITLDIDGLDTGDAEPVTLRGGASTTLELSAETSAGDSGTYTAVVSSADASDRASVGIRTATDPDPAAFGVTIVETNSPVSSGELLEVVVQVENTGDESDRQRLDLILDGEVRDNTEIQLGPGDQQTVTFEWLPRAGQEGDHELAVMSDDDRDTTTVSVVDEGFIVSALSTNSPVEPGETIHVEAEITNVGEGTDTQTVQLRLANGDTTETTRDVQLAGGESETLTWETEASEAGTYELSAQTDDHRESTQLQVEGDTPDDREGDREAGSTFTVTIDSVESNGDGTIQVEATVENTDEMEDTQNVVVEHDGVEQGSQEVTLLGGESESLVFSLSPSSDDIDVVDLEVSSETDFDTSSIDLSVEGPDGTDDTDDSDSLLTSPFPYLLVLVLLVVGGGYYYRRRR